MMFYHYALAHVHALFDIHFFGEGGVKGVCVVNGKYKAVFACGHKIVFGFAESARDFFKHGLQKRRICALLCKAADFLVVEACADCDVLRFARHESRQGRVCACEIVYSRRAKIFSVCAASERRRRRHDVEVRIDDFVLGESRVKIFDVADKRQHVLLYAHRKR